MKHWTTAEDNYLRNHFPNTDLKIIVDNLPGRTRHSIKNRSYRLGLLQELVNWSEADLKFIYENYNKLSINAIARALGKPTGTLYHKIITLGLRKQGAQAAGKHFRFCLSPRDADRMAMFLGLLTKVKRVADKNNKPINIDLSQMVESFKLMETGMR